MSAVVFKPQSDADDPLVNQPRVLPRADVVGVIDAAGKGVIVNRAAASRAAIREMGMPVKRRAPKERQTPPYSGGVLLPAGRLELNLPGIVRDLQRLGLLPASPLQVASFFAFNCKNRSVPVPSGLPE